MLKIAYIIMQWPVASETFAARDVLSLKKLGADVRVFALRPQAKTANALAHSFGVENIPAHSPSITSLFYGICLALRHAGLCWYLLHLVFANEKRSRLRLKSVLLIPSAFWLWHRITAVKPDVVHLFWGHYPSLAGLLVNKTMPQTKVTMFLGANDLLIRYGLSKIMADKAEYVFTHTKANNRALHAIGVAEQKIRCIYRGIDISVARPNVAKIPGKMLFAGRMIREKGIFQLIDVFHQLHKHDPKWQLTMIGSGRDDYDLRAYIATKSLQDCITLTGWLSPNTVFRHMAEAEIFILLSDVAYSERLPNAVKEAMLFGAVPVITRTEGIEELVDDGKNGVILDGRDPTAMVQVLLPLLADGNLLARIASAGAAKICETFDVDKNMQAYLDIWRALTKKSYP